MRFELKGVLDTIRTIREHEKPVVEVKDPLWGKMEFKHKLVLAKLPWLLYITTPFVQDAVVGWRYIVGFRRLLTLQGGIPDETGAGMQPKRLLERLLCESKNAIVFAEPARKVVLSEIESPTAWPFVGILLECLLNPEREYTDWTAQWTLTLVRTAFVPNGPEWNVAANLRDRVFHLLRSHSDKALRSQVWKILADSHNQFHRLLLNDRIRIHSGCFIALLAEAPDDVR